MLLSDRVPHRLEDRGRAGEVDPGELRARERGVADRRARAVDDVDDAVREARLAQDLQRVVGRERGRRRRLPDDGVAHQRRRAGEVAADRGEVERADREDEALERPVLHPVPDPGRGDRLLRVDPEHELDVVAPEVDQLGRGVDLGLVRRLRLVQHRRRDEGRAPRAGEQLGRAEEDGRALLPRQARPVGVRLAGGVDRLLDVLGAALGDVGEDVLLAVRHHRLGRLLRLDLLAADHHRDRDPLALHLRQPDAQLLALGRAGRVAADGLVDRRGRSEDAGSAHAPGRLPLPPGGAGLRGRLTPLAALRPAGRTSVLSPRPTHRERRPRNASKLTGRL